LKQSPGKKSYVDGLVSVNQPPIPASKIQHRSMLSAKRSESSGEDSNGLLGILASRVTNETTRRAWSPGWLFPDSGSILFRNPPFSTNCQKPGRFSSNRLPRRRACVQTT